MEAASLQPQILELHTAIDAMKEVKEKPQEGAAEAIIDATRTFCLASFTTAVNALLIDGNVLQAEEIRELSIHHLEALFVLDALATPDETVLAFRESIASRIPKLLAIHRSLQWKSAPEAIA